MARTISVRRAIYWTDARAARQTERLREEMGEEIIRECYNSVSSLWTLPQLIWLRENEPETLRRTRRLLAVKDYVRYRLTGDFVTDSIEAMGFLLLDARVNRWSERLCGLAGISTGGSAPDCRPDGTPLPADRAGVRRYRAGALHCRHCWGNRYCHGGLCGWSHPAGPGHGQAGHGPVGSVPSPIMRWLIPGW